MDGIGAEVMLMICAPARGARVKEEAGRVTARPGWRTKRELSAKKMTTRKTTLTSGMRLKSQIGIFCVRVSYMPVRRASPRGYSAP